MRIGGRVSSNLSQLRCSTHCDATNSARNVTFALWIQALRTWCQDERCAVERGRTSFEPKLRPGGTARPYRLRWSLRAVLRDHCTCTRRLAIRRAVAVISSSFSILAARATHKGWCTPCARTFGGLPELTSKQSYHAEIQHEHRQLQRRLFKSRTLE